MADVVTSFPLVVGFVAMLIMAFASWVAMVVYGVKAIRRTRVDEAGGRRTSWNRANELFLPAQFTPEGLAYRRKCFVAVGPFLASIGAPLLIGGAIVVSDIRDDRRCSVTLAEGMPLFSEARVDCGRKHPTLIGFALPGKHLQVLRIRYGKDCRTVRISTSSGESGWLLENSSVSVSKP